mgnify:FL=1
MAGEHILKLLDEPDARLSIGDKWLVRWEPYNTSIFTVYQRKKYQKSTRVLIETESEELACEILKGE